MRRLSFLIKPVSSQCNLRCRYCFYDDVSDRREKKSYGVMSEETAEKLIRAACDVAGKGGEVHFAFQGGEPTLAGLDFFRRFIQCAGSCAQRKLRVSYSIQTNGTLLDEAWAAFFKENQFLVGLSVDGDRALHDLNRVDAGGKGSWGDVVKGLRCLQKAEVDVNFLCVVTASCARHPQQVYGALKRLGGQYLQFIPCLDPIGAERGGEKYSLTTEAYGGFLCRLFDAWYEDWKHGAYCSVRQFDDHVHLLTGGEVSACTASGHCGRYLVVEADGGLYPCDFYVLDPWRLGTVGEEPLASIMDGQRERRFLEEGESRPERCRTCSWFPICRGGCKRDWVRQKGETVNYFCEAYRQFFSHSITRLREIAAAELEYEAATASKK
ncbi:MAG: anaerobic sulfatase maturase [Oscillospiraceae bacterium]|nr:anaerobic sulfatase maturase [Oscillospiraceae bacterium]